MVSTIVSAEQSNNITTYVAITINSIKIQTTNGWKYELALENRTGKCLKLSRFSLANAINNGLYCDSKGQVWKSFDGKIKDAPPPDIDYSILLNLKANVTIEMELERLDLVKEQKRTKANDSTQLPDTLNYIVFSKASAISCDKSFSCMVLVGGRGTVNILGR